MLVTGDDFGDCFMPAEMEACNVTLLEDER
jgi:hypothetical protein